MRTGPTEAVLKAVRAAGSPVRIQRLTCARCCGRETQMPYHAASRGGGWPEGRIIRVRQWIR
jgi:hypothetical protein